MEQALFWTSVAFVVAIGFTFAQEHRSEPVACLGSLGLTLWLAYELAISPHTLTYAATLLGLLVGLLATYEWVAHERQAAP